MKAVKKLTGAASAIALSLSPVVTGATIVGFAAITVAEAAIVRSVSVQGNRRVDDSTIRDYVGATAGRDFSDADIDAAVKRLFATGLFSDVRISRSGSTLVISVDEYSVVNQVVFQGNKKLKDAQLRDRVQLQPRGAFDQATLDSDVQAIQDAYNSIGRSDVTVTPRVDDLGEGRVNVVYEISEGGRTRIANINFIGNNAYGDRRLQGVISTKRSNYLSWLTRNDVYADGRLQADEEALRRFYFNRGYADFRVISSVADLDDANNAYTITITVEEGERYTFGDIQIESTVEGVDADALRGELQTRSGQVYSAKDVEDTLIALSERVATSGFAFAQVTPRGDRDFANRTISVTYVIDQGPRTYVERIEIRGNTKTRDYVIRREFDISEGDAFNPILLQRARKRLEALDYFDRIDISTAPGSEPDRVVVIVDVADKSTGEFGLGVGYSTGSSTSGMTAEASISDRNFLGRGQSYRIGVGGTSGSRTYNLSFTEPYFLGYRLSAGFDLYRRTNSYTGYESAVNGGSVRFGLPITEALSAGLSYNYSEEKYSITDKGRVGGVAGGAPDPTVVPQSVIDAAAGGAYVKSSVGASLTFNTVDDIKDPHEGLYVRLTGEFAGAGGDAKFYAATVKGTYFHTLSDEADIVGLVGFGGGTIAGHSGASVRVFDHFRLGPNEIRGFAYNGIGPIDPVSGQRIGGKTYLNATAEAQFPLPVLPRDFGLRGAVFADAATLYGSDVAGATATAMNWRTSVGASVIWASPFGPLRLDYAVPLSKQATDKVQNFNFSISSRF